MMRRTQLYLDDQLWNELHARAREEKTTISELVRRAVRERYFSKLEERKRAMLAIVGIRKGPFAETVEDEVRRMRKDTRMKRIFKK
jgi:metal-responsive CopG/Arc/MetJ family transcriptional regulator